jgi:predicted outer membrane repeat protein
MHNVESSAILNDCIFTGNQAASGRGGAVYSTLMVDVTATNCVFSGNGAVYGGALAQEYRCTANLTNCTFSANEAWAEGGAVHIDLEGTELNATNCVLWGNADIGGSDESAQIDVGRGAAAPTVNYCCIQGWSGELGGTGNIGEDPLLADPDGQDDTSGTEDDDLRLSDSSPCIDAGDNDAVPSDVTTDLDGNERILDGNTDGTATVDMGSYEMALPEPEQPGAPAAVGDSYSIDLSQGSTLDVAAPGVLENDSVPEGSQPGALLVSDVSNGTLTLNADGSFSYTPTDNFRGADSFTYKVNDGTAESNDASVTITVTADGDVSDGDDATGGDEDAAGGEDAAPNPAATDDGDATSSSETGGLPFWAWIPVGLGVAVAAGILIHLIRIWVLAR